MYIMHTAKTTTAERKSRIVQALEFWASVGPTWRSINNAEELDLRKLGAAYICLYLLVHTYPGAISNMDSFSTAPESIRTRLDI